MSLYIQEKPLKATIEKIDGDKVLVSFLGTQKIVLPKKYLPSKAKPKDTFYIDFIASEAMQNNKKEIARSILEEILQGS